MLLVYGLLSFILVACPAFCKEEGAPDRPNLLFIITDQQRYDTLRRTQEEIKHAKSARIHTPFLDQLSREGAYFRNGYTHCPVCGPARTSILTGRTIEHTGIRTNWVVYNVNVIGNDAAEKIPVLRTYDEILVEDYGYVAEYYGKWHAPLSKGFVYNNDVRSVRGVREWFGKYESDNITKRMPLTMSHDYRRWLDENNINNTEPRQGEQLGPLIRRAYRMDPLDRRYLLAPSNSTKDILDQDCHGMDLVPDGYSITALQGKEPLEALERLHASGNPFSLTVSFHYPHPAMVPTKKYYEMYDPNDMSTPESNADEMSNSAYKNLRMNNESGYFNSTNLQRWRANYYGLITEIDEWIGLFMNKLESLGIDDKTLVIFTSDHGEHLGSHGLRSKNTFYEESSHVPLLLRMPGFIKSGTMVDDPVSHLDIHSTILDYMGISGQYESDGSSLRRLVEDMDKEDSFVVTEWNPTDSTKGGNPTSKPAFMIRKDAWKLILPNRARLNTLDMLYNLEEDPHETNNLIGRNGATADEEVIGKAEHLKALLVEYLDKLNNPFVGELRDRRQWRLLPFWVGDTALEFRKPLPDGTRTERLYMGTTSSALNLTISDIQIEGNGAGYFSIDWTQGEISLNGYRILAITYVQSDTQVGALSADLIIRHDSDGTSKTIKLIAPTQRSETPKTEPTSSPTVEAPLPTSSPPVETPLPTANPTESPTVQTPLPTANPTDSPTVQTPLPTSSPTIETRLPTSSPTGSPLVETPLPTASPTESPTSRTPFPTSSPIAESPLPTSSSKVETPLPSSSPSSHPTNVLSRSSRSEEPTLDPTRAAPLFNRTPSQPPPSFSWTSSDPTLSPAPTFTKGEKAVKSFSHAVWVDRAAMLAGQMLALFLL